MPEESPGLAASPSNVAESRDEIVSEQGSSGGKPRDRSKATRERRRCEVCPRFISATGPPRCARHALAEAAPIPAPNDPRIGARLNENSIAAPHLAVVAPAAPVPQPRPADVPIPARSWPPKRTVTPRQLPLPTAVEPPRTSTNDFVIPRPSQLHPPVTASPMPSGVLLPRVRPTTGQATRAAPVAVGTRSRHLDDRGRTRDRDPDPVRRAARPHLGRLPSGGPAPGCRPAPRRRDRGRRRSDRARAGG